MVMEIRDILETSSGGIDQRLINLQNVAQNQQEVLDSISERLEPRLSALESHLFSISVVPRPTSGSGTTASLVYTQALVRKSCSRYCKCQCHTIFTFQTPSWTRPLIGSLLVWYNGTAIPGANPCNVAACRVGGKRAVTVAYSSPDWIFHRALSISAGWNSLTNSGASLHLMLPRMIHLPSLWDAVTHSDTRWLQQMIVDQQLRPSDVQRTGEGILTVSRPDELVG